MKKRSVHRLKKIQWWLYGRTSKATDPRFRQYWLEVRWKIDALISEEGRRRYIFASETYHEEASFPVKTPGLCIWCGKPVPRHKQRFCPGVWEEVQPALRLLYPKGKRRVYHCTTAFESWWLAVPRFKRVVFLRDEFTCQACGLKPVFTNPHGIELPDLSALAVDHKIPLARGGKTELPNLQTLCRKCNSDKGDKLHWSPKGTVTIDEIIQIQAAEKLARESGCQRFTWERGEGGGIIISYGRTNDNTNTLSSEGRGERG
jgi:hypothetical protein